MDVQMRDFEMSDSEAELLDHTATSINYSRNRRHEKGCMHYIRVMCR